MDYVKGLLSSVLTEPQHVEWAIYVIAVITGITLALAIAMLLSGLYSPARQRLQGLTNHGTPTLTAQQQAVDTLEHRLAQVASKPFFKNLFATNDETLRLLIHAGFHSENALAIFNAIKLMLLLTAAIASVITLRIWPELSTLASIYLIAMLLGLAFLLPTFSLQKMASNRMRLLRHGFPDALDLMVVCCEAGLGLSAAIQRVANELSASHPKLAHELNLVCSKVRAGLSMKEALQEFTDRTGLEDIKGLTSAISQSLRLGTGIAATLRVFSEEYRDKRMQEAEEKAAKISVKMIFPMMLFIWPSFFIVAIGPAILKVIKVWSGAF